MFFTDCVILIRISIMSNKTIKKRLDGHPRFLEYVRLEIFYRRLLFNFLPNLATLDFYKISTMKNH